MRNSFHEELFTVIMPKHSNLDKEYVVYHSTAAAAAAATTTTTTTSATTTTTTTTTTTKRRRADSDDRTIGHPSSVKHTKSMAVDTAQRNHLIGVTNYEHIVHHLPQQLDVDDAATAVEYVNVLFESNLLPIQNNAIIADTSGTLNFHEMTSVWPVTDDVLDLDQKPHQLDCGDRSFFQPNPAPINNEDLEDKNLSWLFNFKLDELPHLSPEVNRQPQNEIKKSNVTQENQRSTDTTATAISLNILESTDEDNMVVAESVVIESTCKVPKKPPFTYTELIEYALEDKGELTVSGIYQWISDRFPFYKSNDDRWKNSVRHNLSINPHFRKGTKAPQGAGHLWTIASRDSDANILAWEHKKQRLETFFKMEAANALLSTTAALNRNEIDIGNLSEMDETVAATNSISMNLDQTDMNMIDAQDSNFFNATSFNSINADIPYETEENVEALRRSAGEILNGVRRNVEVQSVHPTVANNFQTCQIFKSGDYLNPVSKDQVVHESGLRSIIRTGNGDTINEYYITEIDPIELGINLTPACEEEVLFGDEFNLNYFGIGPGGNSSNNITA